MASPALSRRRGEDGALTACGRAPPPIARRRAPNSSAGTSRRSTAEPASAASYPLDLWTCDRVERGPKCQFRISISPNYPAPPFSLLSNSLFNIKGISQVAKKKKKKLSLKPLSTYLFRNQLLQLCFCQATQAKGTKKGKKLRDAFSEIITKMKWFYICINDEQRVYASPTAMSNQSGRAFSCVRGAGLTHS